MMDYYPIADSSAQIVFRDAIGAWVHNWLMQELSRTASLWDEVGDVLHSGATSSLLATDDRELLETWWIESHLRQTEVDMTVRQIIETLGVKGGTPTTWNEEFEDIDGAAASGVQEQSVIAGPPVEPRPSGEATDETLSMPEESRGSTDILVSHLTSQLAALNEENSLAELVVERVNTGFGIALSSFMLWANQGRLDLLRTLQQRVEYLTVQLRVLDRQVKEAEEDELIAVFGVGLATVGSIVTSAAGLISSTPLRLTIQVVNIYAGVGLGQMYSQKELDDPMGPVRGVASATVTELKRLGPDLQDGILKEVSRSGKALDSISTTLTLLDIGSALETYGNAYLMKLDYVVSLNQTRQELLRAQSAVARLLDGRSVEEYTENVRAVDGKIRGRQNGLQAECEVLKSLEQEHLTTTERARETPVSEEAERFVHEQNTDVL